jgi:hypothetical protein
MHRLLLAQQMEPERPALHYEPFMAAVQVFLAEWVVTVGALLVESNTIRMV